MIVGTLQVMWIYDNLETQKLNLACENVDRISSFKDKIPITI